jgi:hypothetical protein
MARRGVYRMTPARRAALRKAQAASARKRKGTGKRKPVPSARSRRKAAAKALPRGKRYRNRAAKAAVIGVAGGAAVGAGLLGAGLATYGAQTRSSRGKKPLRPKKRRAASAAHRRNQAANSALRGVYKRTGVKPGTMTGARVAGTGPNRSNRVFVTGRHGTTSVRRRIH